MHRRIIVNAYKSKQIINGITNTNVIARIKGIVHPGKRTCGGAAQLLARILNLIPKRNVTNIQEAQEFVFILTLHSVSQQVI